MGQQAPDIYAILRLRGRPTLEQIVPAMQQLADAHERFRLRVAKRGGSWVTEAVEDFDVRWCMRAVTLDGPDIDAAFNGFVARLMSGPLLSEGHLPPWDCSLVRYSSDPHHTDVLLRCSHMIGDGQLFMQLLKDVLEEQDDSMPAEAATAAMKAAGPGSASSGVEEEDDGAVSSDGASSSSSGGAAVAAAASPSASCSSLSSLGVAGGADREGGGPHLIRAVRHQSAFLPPPSMQRAERDGEARRSGRAGSGENGPGGGGGGGTFHGQKRRPGGGAVALLWRLQRLLLSLWGWITSALFVFSMPLHVPDPVNAVKAAPAEIGGPRAFASVTLPLDEMRHVSKLLGVTINTVAVSCIAGGLRRHLLQTGGGGARAWPWRRGAAADAARGGVPSSLLLCSMVDTRAMQRMGLGGAGAGVGGGCNTLSFIGVPVHTGGAAPLVRLASVAATLSWIRGSLAVLIAVLIPPVLQFFLRDIALSTRLIMWMLPAKATLGFSNMRGPVKPVALRGFPVERMYNGVQPNAFGCFVSLMSYDNQVTIVNSCYVSKSSCPEQLLRCVRDEWAALRDAATVPAPVEEAEGCGAVGAKAKGA
ncbi:hypothetical protein MNEG_5482 [Monoraphidium neglectum]|uniref:Uncharacterized protein n=1 Tax=Monoraphidium neglectum TaxID=145388 RepID=A0A0D2MPQ4_9CHLO|nr:hypothetical protein MNEG_5482 [Monoraphidium neglectum]KIZ02477.1 hypothetical protein MNEG_5482 [Monoraphidium neglectum]|eukprot:XP_013901496.1 hypothetical protein MNEG_5482 [Monoraphidium neglectum]